MGVCQCILEKIYDAASPYLRSPSAGEKLCSASLTASVSLAARDMRGVVTKLLCAEAEDPEAERSSGVVTGGVAGCLPAAAARCTVSCPETSGELMTRVPDRRRSDQMQAEICPLWSATGNSQSVNGIITISIS